MGAKRPMVGIVIRHRRRVACLVLLPAIIAGCGGDETGSVPDANAICGRVVADSRALYQRTGSGDAAQDRAFRRIINSRGEALRNLHELDPPPESRHMFAQMLAHFDKSQQLVQESERLWGMSEEAPFLLVAAAREARKGHAVARELSLDHCVEF